MIWVSPLINILMWVGCFIGAIIIAWGFIPHWGGWRSLNKVGKTIALCGLILFGVCTYGLMNTAVVPL